MKKHLYINSQNVNVNKKWTNLKSKQKEFIQTQLKNQILAFIKENNRKPTKDEKEQIVNNVCQLIEERNVWIPKTEVLLYLNSKIYKWTK